MIPFEVVGHGTYRPRTSVPSTALDRRLGKAEGWVEAEFGISARGVANESETSSTMAAAACTDALAKAGWDEFDVLIGACGVMEQPIPSTSVLVQQKLGLGRSGIPAFDVNQTCLSFLTALDIAAMGMHAKRWRRALIFSSDIASAGLDESDAKTLAIFGDGAAAIAIEARNDDGPGLLACKFETYGEGYDLATLRSGGTRIRVEHGFDALVEGAHFRMDAFGIFKAAARHLPRLIDTVLAQAGATRESLGAIICHQASAPGVEHIRRMFTPGPDRVINIFPTTGNQIAASMPTVLAYALDQGLLRRGETAMLLGTAAGISAGAAVLRL